jgi:hypothetical protein
MKKFAHYQFDLQQCELELSEFKQLLDTKAELSERGDILRFFRSRVQLALQIAMVVPVTMSAERYAFEFDIFGDFVCDLAIGDNRDGIYCFVELEDAKQNSIFVEKGKKHTKEFSSRFEHGYSQIIDWFHKLDDMQKSHSIHDRFGVHEIHYEGVLIIGRGAFLDDSDERRLNWRRRNVIVNSRTITCLTYDQLYFILRQKLNFLKYLAG